MSTSSAPPRNGPASASRDDRIGRVPLLLWSACVAAAAVGGWLFLRLVPGAVPACPFLAITGCPCPTCGGTRALAGLYEGNVAAAIRANPLLTILALAIAASGLLAIVLAVTGTRFPAWSTGRRGRRLAWLAILLILLNWLYLVLMQALH